MKTTAALRRSKLPFRARQVVSPSPAASGRPTASTPPALLLAAYNKKSRALFSGPSRVFSSVVIPAPLGTGGWSLSSPELCGCCFVVVVVGTESNHKPDLGTLENPPDIHSFPHRWLQLRQDEDRVPAVRARGRRCRQ